MLSDEEFGRYPTNENLWPLRANCSEPLMEPGTRRSTLFTVKLYAFRQSLDSFFLLNETRASPRTRMHITFLTLLYLLSAASF